MTNDIPKPPTVRNIVLGIALFILALLAFIRIPDVIKYSGSALMFVPAKLGLIDMPMPGEIVTLSMEQNPSEITFASTGQYILYMNIYDLLVVHDAIVEKDSDPWMKIQSEELGIQVELTLIGRGLAWYDTPFARGRPVVRFTIDQPGTYEFIHPSRPENVYLVPDTMTGKEAQITFWVLTEIALIGGVTFYVVRKRTATKRNHIASLQAQNRARVENSRKRIEKHAEEKQLKEDQPYWKKKQ